MERKTITVSEFVKNGLEGNVVYSITKDKPLKWRIHEWLESKGLDSYSRSVKRDYRKGITKDLGYNNTMDKCSDKQFVKMIWIDGYSDFMAMKHPEEIDKNVERKIKNLIKQGKVGYITGDSYGSQLVCRADDYGSLCRYLNVEYDKDDDRKEYHYNSLFDDIRVEFNECCEANIGCSDKKLYDVSRYVVVNIEKYVDILLAAEETDWDSQNYMNDDFWINKLWIAACKDMKGGK